MLCQLSLLTSMLVFESTQQYRLVSHRFTFWHASACGRLNNVNADMVASLLQVTALQIASLRKVNRRSSILLLDKSGTTSKAIAKELRKKGFKRVRVVQVM